MRKAGIFLAIVVVSFSISRGEAFKHSKAITQSRYPPCVSSPNSSSPSRPWLAYDTLSKPIIKVRQSAFMAAWFLDLPSPSCARLSSYELPPPLKIAFSRVFQDDNIQIQIKLVNVEIKVDPSLNVMTLSYDRKIDQMPEKIILTVLTKESLERWTNDAKRYYNNYEESFWEEKELGRIELEEKARKEKELLDKLR